MGLTSRIRIDEQDWPAFVEAFERARLDMSAESMRGSAEVI
jgi:hypothetical protein